MTKREYSTHPEQGLALRWTSAYRLTLGNAALFATLSALHLMVGASSIPANCVIAAIFLAGSILCAAMLLRAAEGPVAIAMFVLGSGLTFGFGTIYGVVGPLDGTTQILFSRDVQTEYLGKLNLVNALATLCVIGMAGLVAAGKRPAAGLGGVVMALKSLGRYQNALIVASLAVIGLLLATYPTPQNLLLRGLVGTLGKLPLVVLILVASQWRSQSFFAKAAMIAILVVLVGLGVLSTSKLSALIPLGALVAGLWLNGSTRRASVIIGVMIAVGYFTLLAPISGNMRSLQSFNGGAAGLTVSIQNLNSGVQRLGGEERGILSLMRRFSPAPYQAYLIGQYETGRPGSSLQDLWYAAVPRILWADKPSTTRFGGQLYGQINRTANPTSQLAPTFSAEAFWNFGWTGVLVVSLLIGLEIGWLTRKWLDLATGRRHEIGILVLAVPVAFMSFFVESWIAGTYVGGFLTLFLLIKAIDLAMAWVRAPGRGAQSPSPSFERQ